MMKSTKTYQKQVYARSMMNTEICILWSIWN